MTILIRSATKQAKVKANKSSEKGSTKIERGIYRVKYSLPKRGRVYLKFKDTEYQKVFSLTSGERKVLARTRR